MPEIKFPENFATPYDLSQDVEMNAYVITVGYKSYQLSKRYNEAINQSKHSLSHLEMKEEYDKSINEIQVRYEQDLKKLLEENRNLKSSQFISHDQELEELKSVYENKLKKYKDQLVNIESVTEQQIADLKNKLNEQESYIKKSYEEKINEFREKEIELKNKIHNTESLFDETVKNIKKSAEEKYDELKSRVVDQHQTEKNQLMSDIINLRQTIDTLSTSRIEQQEKLRKSLEAKYHEEINYERNRTAQLQTTVTALSSMIQKPSNIVETGQIGEEMIENWTKELFHSADVTVTAKEAHAADLHVKLHNRVLLMEIKNKAEIHKKDIDKFVRDVEVNSNTINGALFISLNTPKVPNKGDFALEYIGEIPVIYCHVPDRQTLKVLIKTLLHLNSKEDSGALTLIINQIYGSIKTMSSASVSMTKNLDDCRTNLESLKWEIKDSLATLDGMFNESPDLKIEKSVQHLEYKPEEIKILCETYAINKKAKVSDYMNALKVTQKYLLDRGGAAKIKSIVQSSNISSPTLTFNIPPPTLQIS